MTLRDRDDTDGEKDPPARPVRAHGRSGRHLVEHRGVEHPVVQAYDPANELDEERPDEHAISGDGRGARPDAEYECP